MSGGGGTVALGPPPAGHCWHVRPFPRPHGRLPSGKSQGWVERGLLILLALKLLGSESTEAPRAVWPPEEQGPRHQWLLGGRGLPRVTHVLWLCGSELAPRTRQVLPTLLPFPLLKCHHGRGHLQPARWGGGGLAPRSLYSAPLPSFAMFLLCAARERGALKRGP